MSAPHPDGLGAQAAMQEAMTAANLRPADIGYVNAHGTATLANDRAEAAAMRAVFGQDPAPISSTKGITGHTLGAAGGLEAVICALALQHGLLPGGINTHERDPALSVNYLMDNQEAAPRHVLSNSFGFGGTNCSLIFGRAG
jgi:3-oxoacyl-[acyl-carrier-protein] synthase-1